MGPAVGGRRYPSPLVKQDLAKLGKDAESRRAALASLRSVVEEHLDSGSLARFLQQVEDSREGRRHVAPILEDLARAHGPSLAPHIPRLLHLLVHALLASAGSPALLAACAGAVSSVARHCAGGAADEVLRQVCLPLMALLPNKIPPLSTGAAACLRSLVDSEQWRFAPAVLVDDICWKAAMAAAAPPTQTVAHMLLLRSLATANASAIAKFAPPLLRLSLDILLTPAATTSWQLRLSAVHLLESLLKASDYAALAAHLHPSLAALAKCRRHDKLPQVRKAVLQALQTAEALQRQQTKHSKPDITNSHVTHHRRKASDPFSDSTRSVLPSQISHSPLTSPRRLNSLSARAPAINESPPDESDFFFSYFYDADESPPWRKIVHHIHEPPPTLADSTKSSAKTSPQISIRKPSRIRQVSVPSLPLSASGIGQGYGHNSSTEFGRNNSQIGNADRGFLQYSARGNVRYLPEIHECEVSATISSSATREIAVFGSNDELLASCERNLNVNDICDRLGCESKSSLRGQFAEARLDAAQERGMETFSIAPNKRNQAVNTESGPQHDGLNSMLHIEGESSAAASVHLFNSLAHLATVDKRETANVLDHQEGNLPAADSTPDHFNTERPEFSVSDLASPTSEGHERAQRQGLAEPMIDTEAETSSGEWSVRDNPIADDHAEDMDKHREVSQWPHTSSSLQQGSEINKHHRAHSGAGSEKDSHLQLEEISTQVNANEHPPPVEQTNNIARVDHQEPQHGIDSDENWAEIEELRDQTTSLDQCAWTVEPSRASHVHNRPVKMLLCAGLLISMAITVLTRHLQHNAVAQFLPPT